MSSVRSSGNRAQIELRYDSIVGNVLGWLEHLFPNPRKYEYILKSVESVLAMIPDSLHASLIKEPNDDVNEQRPTYYYSVDEESADDWRSIEPVKMWIDLLHSNADQLTDQQELRGWQLLHWYDGTGTGSHSQAAAAALPHGCLGCRTGDPGRLV